MPCPVYLNKLRIKFSTSQEHKCADQEWNTLDQRKLQQSFIGIPVAEEKTKTHLGCSIIPWISYLSPTLSNGSLAYSADRVYSFHTSSSPKSNHQRKHAYTSPSHAVTEKTVKRLGGSKFKQAVLRKYALPHQHSALKAIAPPSPIPISSACLRGLSQYATSWDG